MPFTRAGCDVGAYSTANIVIERTPFDVNKVLGNPSPEASDKNQFFDFAGIAVHCAYGSRMCGNPNTKAVDDALVTNAIASRRNRTGSIITMLALRGICRHCKAYHSIKECLRLTVK